MNIYIHQSFRKAFHKRIFRNKQLTRKYQERYKLFRDNSNHPLLKNHQLEGAKRQLFSFSVTGDVRVVYRYLDGDNVELLDIGTHNQVY